MALDDFLDSAGNFIKSVIENNGIVYASPSTINERAKHCNACEKKHFGLCTVCGCIIKTKIAIASSFCPLDKWKAELQRL